MAATLVGRHAGRRRRQRHQHGRRPRHRRRHAADPRPAAGDRGGLPGGGLVFAIALEVVAFVELWTTVNLLSAALAVTATLFYVFVYTLWLKRTSRQNIVIGGAAGAVPVLVGWAAVRGSLGWAPVVLFALIFVWTPPHFWALAIRYRDDYRSAKVPMMPVVTSFKSTAAQILGYSLLVVAVSLLFAWSAGMGPIFWASAVVLGAVFCACRPRVVAPANRGPGHAAVSLVDHLRDPPLRGHGGRSAHLSLTAAARSGRRRAEVTGRTGRQASMLGPPGGGWTIHPKPDARRPWIRR